MQKLWVPIVLAWAAGFVDSLGFVALSHEFTSHMSGNAAATGAELGSGNFLEALIIGSAIPGFVLGVCAGVAIDIWAKRREAGNSFLPVLLLECALLVGFVLISAAVGHPAAKGSLRFFLLVECLAVAMGLQASVLRCAQNVKVSTTFVTGMLTNMSEEFTRYLLLPRSNAERGQAGFHAALFGGIFLAFMIGGVGGAVGHHHLGAYALAAPLGVLLTLATVLQKEVTRGKT